MYEQKYYTVGKNEYQYNDEIYYRGDIPNECVTPLQVYTSREKAEAKALYLTRLALIGTLPQQYGWIPSLMETGYGYQEVFSNPRLATEILANYGFEDEEFDYQTQLGQYVAKMTDEDFEQFYHTIRCPYFTVVEVIAVSENEQLPSLAPQSPKLQVVFTGFRDEDLEELVRKFGGIIQDNVTKTTSHVVAADPTEVTGKVKKAKEYGIPVITETQLKKLFKVKK